MDDAIKNVICGILIIDKRFSILDISDEFENITEYKLSELKEKSIEIINDTFLEKIYLQIKNKSHNVINDELTIRTKSKIEKSIKRRVSFIISNNDVEKIVISIVDIGDSKKYELEIFNFQKMETLSAITKSIALEYNNLLAAIIGFSSFLKSMINPTNEIYNYLNIIENNANKASTLTNQLMSFAGNNYFRQAQIELNKLIKSNVDIFQKSLTSNISIKENLYQGAILLYWDENQIHQIIINTILNSKEAIEDAKIEEGIIEISTNIVDGNIVYEISDNGIGISDDNIDKIFEPYYTTKEIGKHTGLGLSVTQGIIKNMNGAISCKQNEKKTVFTITIPYKEPNMNELFVKDFRGSNQNILIIDDVDEIRNLASVLLKNKGFNPIGAKSGKMALDILHNNKIDLVLLDIVMPEMTGEEFFKVINKLYPEIPVILLTGCMEENIVKSMTEKGLKDAILKPFQTFDFYNKIAKIFNN